MRDDPTVVDLVTRARDGDKTAWDELVERYAPLVWSVCCRYGLDRPDASDVSQSVWLRLVEHLPALREPAALPGWLATTTQRECLRVLRAAQRQERVVRPVEQELAVHEQSAMVEHELLIAERNAALRVAFAELPSRCRRLLSVLMEDPPPRYADVGARLGMPVGAIGPTRARCLGKLRRSPVLAAVIGAELETAGGERRG
jgi:RNA polymerase sigma factor (sigma-70 family)